MDWVLAVLLLLPALPPQGAQALPSGAPLNVSGMYWLHTKRPQERLYTLSLTPSRVARLTVLFRKDPKRPKSYVGSWTYAGGNIAVKFDSNKPSELLLVAKVTPMRFVSKKWDKNLFAGSAPVFFRGTPPSRSVLGW